MIEVRNVTKKYGNFVAVDDINFYIKEGEIVGFLGANGAGKSTTMNMITGYIEATSGEIIINGIDNVKHAKKTKKKIGYMPENTPLYNDLTVKEFVSYMAELRNISKKIRKEQVQKAIAQTGLEDVQRKLIKNLSRGYKQRVSLAGALVGEPEILILDEPTVGLDPKQVTEIRKLIKSLGKNHTVILSSHILSEVSQICEKIIIINKGKIIVVDTPSNIEEMVKEKNSISIIVEDTDSKMEKIKESIPEIEDVILKKENNDNSKEYIINANKDVDLRKRLFEELQKLDITILELKKVEITLEEAFIKLTDKKLEEKENDEKVESAEVKEEKEAEVEPEDVKSENVEDVEPVENIEENVEEVDSVEVKEEKEIEVDTEKDNLQNIEVTTSKEQQVNKKIKEGGKDE